MPRVVTELQSREELLAAAKELRDVADAICVEKPLEVNKIVARRIPVDVIRKWLQDVREVTHTPRIASRMIRRGPWIGPMTPTNIVVRSTRVHVS